SLKILFGRSILVIFEVGTENSVCGSILPSIIMFGLENHFIFRKLNVIILEGLYGLGGPLMKAV
ncbi:hypothetical protein ACJX0J_014035, partial [Zea mays]